MLSPDLPSGFFFWPQNSCLTVKGSRPDLFPARFPTVRWWYDINQGILWLLPDASPQPRKGKMPWKSSCGPLLRNSL